MSYFELRRQAAIKEFADILAAKDQECAELRELIEQAWLSGFNRQPFSDFLQQHPITLDLK